MQNQHNNLEGLASFFGNNLLIDFTANINYDSLWWLSAHSGTLILVQFLSQKYGVTKSTVSENIFKYIYPKFDFINIETLI